MLRFVNICLFLGLGALAYVIYQVKYEARALDEEIVSLSKSIESERDGIAVLRAEWSLLNRPERIERLARKYLQLAPASPRQLVALDKVTPADLERAPLIAAKQEQAPEARPPAAKPVAATPLAATPLAARAPAAKPVAAKPATAKPAPRAPVQAAAQ